MIINKLSEVASIQISNVDKKIKDGQKSIKLCNYVDVYYKWAITEKNSHDLMVSTASDLELSKFSLMKGDVLLTKDSETKDDIGISAYVADQIDDLVLGYHCALIRPDNKVLFGSYLNIIFHSQYAQRYFKNSASGSGQRYTLTEDIIKNFPVPIISLEEQQKIASVFSSMDRIVESNIIFIEKMEKFVKSLYDYWFLQFEFPNLNGRVYKTNGGIFQKSPDTGKDIPIGWHYVKLKQLCSLKNGINYDKNSLGGKEYLIVNVRNISSSLTIIDSNKLDSIELDPINANKYIVGKNDIIIARSGSPGSTRLLMDTKKDVIFCGFIICCTPINPEMRLYLTNYLKMYEGTNATKTGGSILTNVSQETLNNLDVLVPPDYIIDKFNSLVEPVYGMIETAINANYKLESLTRTIMDHVLALMFNQD